MPQFPVSCFIPSLVKRQACVVLPEWNVSVAARHEPCRCIPPYLAAGRLHYLIVVAWRAESRPSEGPPVPVVWIPTLGVEPRWHTLILYRKHKKVTRPLYLNVDRLCLVTMVVGRDTRSTRLSPFDPAPRLVIYVSST